MFYQKYRPKNFDQVFGNKSIVETLLNGVNNKNLPHALLFYGPRGTGKTTTARLLAKIMVCENPKENGDACTVCDSCLEVASGNYPDVFELDAASNNSVENIRAINERVSLTPTRGKIKMYIIDEVHMLSKGAFNALLKTLEEPPKNTYFVLATTELDKVLDTIKSRCTIFEFKRATNKDIVDKLKYISTKESLNVEETDLKKIAAASKGGFRDAETLLESMVIGNLSVEEVLNSAGGDFVYRFFDSLVANNLPLSIQLIDTAYKSGKNLESLNKEILFYLRQIVLLKNDLNDLCELDESLLKLAKDQSLNFNNSFLLKCLKFFNVSLEQLKLTYIPTLPLEIAVYEIIGNGGATLNTGSGVAPTPNNPVEELKLKNQSAQASEKLNGVGSSASYENSSSSREKSTFSPDHSESDYIIRQSEESKEKKFQSYTKSIPEEVYPPKSKTVEKDVRIAEDLNQDIDNSSFDTSNFTWNDFLDCVEKQKPSLMAILNVVEFKGFKGRNLVIEAKYAFHKERLEFTSTKTFLVETLRGIIHSNCSITCELLQKQKENLTDKNIEYVTVKEGELPVVEKKPKADDFSIPMDDDSFVASPVTVEEQLKKMAKDLASAPAKNPTEEALDSFSGDFSV